MIAQTKTTTFECVQCGKICVVSSDKDDRNNTCKKCSVRIKTPQPHTGPPPLPPPQERIEVFPVVPSDQPNTVSKPHPRKKTLSPHAKLCRTIVIVCLIILGSATLTFAGYVLYTTLIDSEIAPPDDPGI